MLVFIYNKIKRKRRDTIRHGVNFLTKRKINCIYINVVLLCTIHWCIHKSAVNFQDARRERREGRDGNGNKGTGREGREGPTIFSDNRHNRNRINRNRVAASPSGTFVAW